MIHFFVGIVKLSVFFNKITETKEATNYFYSIDLSVKAISRTEKVIYLKITCATSFGLTFTNDPHLYIIL